MNTCTSTSITKSTRSVTAIRFPTIHFTIYNLLLFFLDKLAYRKVACGMWRLLGERGSRHSFNNLRLLTRCSLRLRRGGGLDTTGGYVIDTWYCHLTTPLHSLLPSTYAYGWPCMQGAREGDSYIIVKTSTNFSFVQGVG